MAKPITQEQKDEFRAFCEEAVTESEHGCGYFSLCAVPLFDEETEDGTNLWECHAQNYDPDNTHDIFELFGEVADEFRIERDGYEDFFVSRV